MNDEVLFAEWERRGYYLGNVSVRDADGMLLFEINGVFMFKPDLRDLATGAAKISDILFRTKTQVFPEASLLENDPARDEDIVQRVDFVAKQAVDAGEIEIHTAFPYTLTPRENDLVQRRIAWWLRGKVNVR